MLTRRHVAPALAAFLLAAAAAPSRGVEVVFVPAAQQGVVAVEPGAPACHADGCGRPAGRWGHSCSKACFGYHRPVCDPCSLPNAGFYPTRWRYLPPEPEYHHAPAASAPSAETPPADPAANNKEPPAKKKPTNNDPDDKAEKLPPPRKKPMR